MDRLVLMHYPPNSLANILGVFDTARALVTALAVPSSIPEGDVIVHRVSENTLRIAHDHQGTRLEEWLGSPAGLGLDRSGDDFSLASR